MGTNISPVNEAERVAVLKRYRILNTPEEQAFNSIAQLAKTILNAPVAHISFLDDRQEFIKASTVVTDSTSFDIRKSICALAILEPEVTVFEDTLKEPLLAKNAFVHQTDGIRFYAGAPIISPDGFIIGTMCVADMEPRSFSAYEKEVLQGLAKIVMEQTELRLSTILESEKLKNINEKLSFSEQRLQGILDTMAEGVGIIDKNGKLIYANLMAQRIFGLSENEIIERTYDDPKWQNLRIDGSPLPKQDHPMAIMMRTGLAVYDQEISIKPPNGEQFYISINAAPILDQEGNLSGGIGTFMDVTNRRVLLQQKEEFISIASHELKTPVTSLKASMQIINRIKDNPSPVIMSKMIDQANRSLHKLSSLINDLLNTNRITQGQLQLRKTVFTVAEMINDCCNHIRTAGTHTINLQGNLDLQIYADEQQIDQVMVNMVNNAVKYAPDAKEITICVEQLAEFTKISVKDKGLGVPPEKIPHLFDRYYRADYSGIQFSGLGLGLYISAEIIKKHGGEIGVDSEPGNGSTFWFTLPVK